MELFTKPGVGGIIEKRIHNIDYILIQERCKEDAESEYGLLEIPAGKIREFENIYDCLRREVKEETGLTVSLIQGEEDAMVLELNGYRVLNYTPFSCSQNIKGTYPILVETFICSTTGDMLYESNETKNLRWISLSDLENLLSSNIEIFYPMHVITLKKYLKMKSNLC